MTSTGVNRVPPGMPFGDLRITAATLPAASPAHPRLRDEVPPPLSVPALLPFPLRGSLLIKANGDGRARGITLLQTVMLRYLTSLPPGKVRFTIFDPVGLGENFAAFAHLADHDEKLITARIWTEAGHFEQRLAETSTTMAGRFPDVSENGQIVAALQHVEPGRSKGDCCTPNVPAFGPSQEQAPL